jgi:hypothetical protein
MPEDPTAAVLTGPAPQSIERLLDAGSPFVPPGRALEDLGADLACRRIDGAPHTIAEIVAHLGFWQAYTLSLARLERPPLPEHAADGWPTVRPQDWDETRRAFLAGLEEAGRVAREQDLSVLVGQRETLGYELTVLAIHNAAHLGQVILLRRMLGAWPPPGGGDTW